MSIDGPLVTPDNVRARFSAAMSRMYRAEVPQYGTLVSLVADVNAARVAADPALHAQLRRGRELDRVGLERHGAIRLGTEAELATMRRLFAVMGMVAVGYYDLSVAGVPVHSTAFRPVDDDSLAANPFRVFTSLLRLELIEDAALRGLAEAILRRRRIFTPAVLALIERSEKEGGLTAAEADRFVAEATETFRWHREATVDAATYRRLSDAHRLVADVVSFRGPHINHLTPRTLDIDEVQRRMPAHGIVPKDVIEGPPPRACPILLRQTSFRALAEPVVFAGEAAPGTHTARFGEIEQRGVALTHEGRALYDRLLDGARAEGGGGAGGEYADRLEAAFREFPDDADMLRRRRLGYFRYVPAAEVADMEPAAATMSVDDLVATGHVHAVPIVYEDFLPVSAAGIFQSNLGGSEVRRAAGSGSRDGFVAALGGEVLDEFALYEAAQERSIAAVRTTIRGVREGSGDVPV